MFFALLLLLLWICRLFFPRILDLIAHCFRIINLFVAIIESKAQMRVPWVLSKNKTESNNICLSDASMRKKNRYGYISKLTLQSLNRLCRMRNDQQNHFDWLNTLSGVDCVFVFDVSTRIFFSMCDVLHKTMCWNEKIDSFIIWKVNGNILNRGEHRSEHIAEPPTPPTITQAWICVGNCTN